MTFPSVVRKTLLFFPLLFTLKVYSQGFSTTDAVEYNDYIVQQQNLIGDELVAFTAYFSEEEPDPKAMQATFDRMVKTTEQCQKNVMTLSAFKGNTELKNAAEELFGFYLTVERAEYKELMSILLKPEILPADEERIGSMIDDIVKREAVYDEKFSAAQEAFAAEHNITLEPRTLEEDANN